MNKKQRQFILLTWLMAMLCIVSIFFLVYAPDSPVNSEGDTNNITQEDPVEDEEIQRGFSLPGIFGDAYEGLVAIYEDFRSGMDILFGEDGLENDTDG